MSAQSLANPENVHNLQPINVASQDEVYNKLLNNAIAKT
jgi:hypothetical protein